MNATMKQAQYCIRLIICLVLLCGVQWAFAQADFWEQTNGPYGGIILEIAINSSNGHIFAGTDSSGVFRSTDNGDTWTAVNTGLTNLEVRSLAISPTTGHIFAGTNSGVLRSTDNGDNWTAVGLINLRVASIAINTVTGSIFALAGGGVFRSTNNGDSWTPVNSGLTNPILNSIAINASGHIFAGANTVFGWGAGVFRSTNNGDSWTEVNTGLLPHASIVSIAINLTTGDIFAGSGAGVFLSANNGDSWTAANAGLSSNHIWSLAINASGHIFAGTYDRGVFRSINNGDNWIAVNTGLPETTISSLAINASGYIFAGTRGGGVFRSVQSTTAVEEIAAEEPSSFELARNYPNPFNPETRIKFHVPATSWVRLEVFNLMGQHIATLLEEKRPAGEHELSWDGRNDLGENVPSGIYVLSIRAGEFTQTRKMMLTR